MKQALLALCFASAVLAQTATKSSTASASQRREGAAKRPRLCRADLLHPSTLNQTAPPSYRVKLATTKGDILIEVTRAWAPRGADRFYNLVRAGFFTDCAFYRVIPGFMAQFGVSAAGRKPRVQGSYSNYSGRSAQRPDRTSAAW